MIPKHNRRASESHSHETRSYDTTSATMPANTLHYDTRSLQMPSPMQSMPTSSAAYGYTLPPSSTLPVSMPPQAASLSQAAATYDPFAVQGPGILPPSAVESPISHRASSGAWTTADDNTLLQARAQGLNWSQIQNNYFPSKTSNACRKRHERLMERRGQDDFDARRMERLAREYMGMRREIWQGLAARTGEKWNVVEAKVGNPKKEKRKKKKKENRKTSPPRLSPKRKGHEWFSLSRFCRETTCYLKDADTLPNQKFTVHVERTKEPSVSLPSRGTAGASRVRTTPFLLLLQPVWR